MEWKMDSTFGGWWDETMPRRTDGRGPRVTPEVPRAGSRCHVDGLTLPPVDRFPRLPTRIRKYVWHLGGISTILPSNLTSMLLRKSMESFLTAPEIFKVSDVIPGRKLDDMVL